MSFTQGGNPYEKMQIGKFKPVKPEPFTFPKATKVAASLLGTDLVAVKPMAAPKGNLRYLDFKYDKTSGPKTNLKHKK